MSEPTVCAILLTRDRPELARRAVESFRAQTYKQKRLLIVNSGSPLFQNEPSDILEPCFVGADAKTIGVLRNIGCAYSSEPDVFVHWDDDDWSHPNRISEQVALLQSSGADCVGYREVIFWHEPTSDAYLYTNNDQRYLIGSSMCYWRTAWEKCPFEDVNREEDGRWIKGANTFGISSFGECDCHDPSKPHTPRMICRIHDGNAAHYPVEELIQVSPNWKRTPQWDDYCRAIMEAK